MDTNINLSIDSYYRLQLCFFDMIKYSVFFQISLIVLWLFSFVTGTVPVKQPEPMEPLTEIPDEAPTVTFEPQNLIVDESEPATFTCKIKGSPGKISHLPN